MNTFAVVPVKKFENGKVRLSSILDVEERIRLSSLMLDNTLSVLAGAQPVRQVVVVSSDGRAKEISSRYSAKFIQEEKESGVNAAVLLADKYCKEQGADASIVVPQDLPLLDANDISMVCDLAENEDRCIVICPSQRYDGTNLLLRKPPSVLETHYDNDSYDTHIKIASDRGILVKLFLSRKVMSDIDTPEDAMQLAGEQGSGKPLEFIKSKFG